MLILLRHGRTPNNAQARLQGQYDSPLDEVGVAQAAAAGDYIRSRWTVDEVGTSPQTRTLQTVEGAGFVDLDVQIDERWREIDFGTYDQRRISDVIKELGQRWRADPGFVPEDGESMISMHERVSGACAELSRRAIDRNVLVVSHATPIKCAAVWALGGPVTMIMNMWVNLGTVTVLGENYGDFLLREFNTRPA